MWQFFSQYGWIILFIGMMLFMHRSGSGGCCGGHKHDTKKDHDKEHL